MALDADLLFGRIALQMRFVTREQVVECTAACHSAAGRALGQELLDRSFISEHQHREISRALDAEIARAGQ